MRQKPIFLFFTILVITFFPYSAIAILSAPEVFISSYALTQADTLLVVVKNQSAKITGRLGSVKMRFFRSENNKDWIALVGMPVNKNPGTYNLVITIPGKALFTKNIKVSKRNFKITTMPMTPELLKKGYTPNKIINTVRNEENKAINKVLNNIDLISYVNKPFIYPLSEIKIVGDYGDIRTSHNDKIQHLGVDLKASKNTFLYALNDGKITIIKNLPDYGNTAIINHGLGVYSLYLHLAEFKVENGRTVKQGDIIGLSGDTGYVTAPHLHFSIKIRGASVDPLKFIEATKTIY